MSVYDLVKPKLLNLLLLRKTNTEIAKEFDIDYKLASKWRNRLFREMGELNDEKVKTLRREFLTRKTQELQMLVLKLFQVIQTAEPTQIPQVVNAWTGLTRSEMDIYTKFGVLAPDKQEHLIKTEDVTYETFNELYEKHYGNKPLREPNNPEGHKETN